MTVVMMEGFDIYNGVGNNTGLATKWAQGGILGTGLGTPALTTGRFTGQCLRITGGAATNAGYAIQRTLTTPVSAFSMGFAFRTSSLAIAPWMLHLLNAGTYQVGLQVNTLGAVIAGRHTAANSATALGTSANGVIAANTWHYIEVEVEISDTVGVFKVYVDGVQVLNLTSQDTRNGTPTTVDTIFLGLTSASNYNGYTVDFDDVYFNDTSTKLGERRVETLYPSADVAQGFARSTGSTNYTLVDEAQVNGDTDYVQGSSVGDTDTYDFANLSSTPTTINAVQINAFAEKTDAASRSIYLQAVSGATTSDGSAYALAASYGKFERLLTADPNGGGAWSGASVNALRGGPKVAV